MPHADALIVEETLTAVQLCKEFRRAMKHNLVMDFDTYCDRFGFDFDESPKENKNNLPCEPMVYVNANHANPPYWYEGNIVSNSCITGHRDIIGVVGEYFPDVMFCIVKHDEDGYWESIRLEMISRAEDGKFHLDEENTNEDMSYLVTVLAEYSKWPEDNCWYKER